MVVCVDEIYVLCGQQVREKNTTLEVFGTNSW